MDTITLTGLSCFGRHGVHAAEQQLGQRFVIDAELRVATLAASDKLADTVNYADVAAGIEAIVAGEPVKLIETLAERIASYCLTYSGVVEVSITVHKPHAPISQPCRDVAVTIHRRAS